MTSTIQQLIELNNKSISLLECGLECKAVHALKGSISLVKDVARTQQQRPDSWKISSSDQESPSVFPAHHAMRDLESPDFFIFNRCMQLDSTTTPLAVEGILPICSACVLLNLALVHHRLGVHNALGHNIFILKAEKLYLKALQLLQSPLFAASCSSSPATARRRRTVLSMRLVAVNNLAVIRLDTCPPANHKDDSSLLQALRFHAILTEATSQGTFFSDLELRKFAMNAKRLGEATLICGAAAA